MNSTLNKWLLVLLWVIAFPLLTLYGEYIVSRNRNEWVQYFVSVLVLIFVFFLLKNTYKLIVNNKFFKK
jgi:hypothetical protein